MSIEIYRKKYGPFQPFEHLELKNLPRLPLPTLEHTCKTYLEWCRPLLSAEEFACTREVVGDFLRSGEGASLHSELSQQAASTPTHWLDGYWDSWYLEPRCPVAVHVNPAFTFRRLFGGAEGGGFLLTAAALLEGTARFAAQVRAPGRLSGDVEGRQKTPLCMSQYGRALGTWRVPLGERDEVFTSATTRHALVLLRSRFFRLELMDDAGLPLAFGALEAALRALLDGCGARRDADVGVLTSWGRDEWARARGRLLALGGGAELLEAADTALIVLALEEEPSGGIEGFHARLLHSTRDRWFDKLQIVVSADGYGGVNMEHAPYDGHTTMRLCGFLYDHLRQTQKKEMMAPEAGTPALAPFAELAVPTLTPALRADVRAAEAALLALVDALDLVDVSARGFGKAFAVARRFSPDALCQVAFQLAYFRAFGRVQSTYESTLTKQFYHGRTECTRSVTDESKRACELWVREADADAKRQAVRAAAAAHSRRTQLCKRGMGADRHLFALWNVALQRRQRLPGYRMPALFLDPAYAKESTSVLSTSNCGGHALQLFAFAPVCDHGVGLGYMIHKDSVQLCITTWRGKAALLARCFEQTVEELKELFLEPAPASSSSKL